MKIYVLGSTSFVKEMVESVDTLRKSGHDGWIHPYYIDYVQQENHPHLKRIEDGEQSKIKIENDYIRQHYRHILASDAVFVVNGEKTESRDILAAMCLLSLGKHM